MLTISKAAKFMGKFQKVSFFFWKFYLKCVLPRQLLKLEMHAEIYIGPHVKYLLLLMILAKIGI